MKLEKKIIKAGVIGLGVGQKHLEVLVNRPDVVVNAVCDFDVKKKDIAMRFDLGHVFYNEVWPLFATELDLVVIASYDEYHVDHVITALKQNMNVFVEKPLCLNKEELNLIKNELSKNTSLQVSSNFILRTEPRFIELKRKIQNGDLGKVYYVYGAYDYGRGYKISEGWRGKTRNYSVMLGGGIHMIDLVSWLTDTEFIPEFNQSSSMLSLSENFEDFQCSHGRLSNGAKCSIVANYGSKTKHYHQIKVYGSKGTYVHQFNRGFYSYGDDRDTTIIPDQIIFPASHKGLLLNEYVEYLVNNNSELIIDKDYVIRNMEISLNAI